MHIKYHFRKTYQNAINKAIEFALSDECGFINDRLKFKIKNAEPSLPIEVFLTVDKAKLTSKDRPSKYNVVSINCAKIYREDLIQVLSLIPFFNDKDHPDYHRVLPSYLNIVTRYMEIKQPDDYKELLDTSLQETQGMEIIKINSVVKDLLIEKFTPLNSPPASAKISFLKYIKMKGALSIERTSTSDEDGR